MEYDEFFTRVGPFDVCDLCHDRIRTPADGSTRFHRYHLARRHLDDLTEFDEARHEDDFATESSSVLSSNSEWSATSSDASSWDDTTTTDSDDVTTDSDDVTTDSDDVTTSFLNLTEVEDLPACPEGEGVLCLMLSHVEHIRSLVLSECSAIDLARLLGTSKAIRKVAESELGRRCIDITVTDHGESKRETSLVVDENGARKETLLIAESNGRRRKTVQGFPFSKHYRDYRELDYHKSLLVQLGRHSRIRNMEFRHRKREQSRYIDVLYEHEGLFDLRKDQFFADTIKMPLCEENLNVLLLFSPRRLRLTHAGENRSDEYEIIEQYLNRGMISAEEIEVDDRDRANHFSALETALPFITAPIIDTKQHFRLCQQVFYGIVRQWQNANRDIVMFCSAVWIVRKSPTSTLHLLRVDIIESVWNTTEEPYPEEKDIPDKFIQHANKMTERWGSTDEAPLAVRATREGGGADLLILLKKCGPARIAVGMYQQ